MKILRRSLAISAADVLVRLMIEPRRAFLDIGTARHRPTVQKYFGSANMVAQQLPSWPTHSTCTLFVS
jgi:hypothetical protein